MILQLVLSLIFVIGAWTARYNKDTDSVIIFCTMLIWTAIQMKNSNKNSDDES